MLDPHKATTPSGLGYHNTHLGTREASAKISASTSSVSAPSIPTFSIMNLSNPNPPTSRSQSTQRRGHSSSSVRPDRPYLTYEDLHARFSPPHSPSLRMPRVQRSLSADDLLQRFRSQQREMQGQDLPAISAPSFRPPAVPPDLEALRSGQHGEVHSQTPPAVSVPSSPTAVPHLNRPTKQTPSTKLPDPPVFSGTNSHVPFDDWKLRIQDKLTHNSDHYPSESFKIAYVVTRLGGEASQHVTLKRREIALVTSKDLLDQLSNLYETPLPVIYKENRHALHHLKQGTKQSFSEFYAEWVRYSERGYDAVDEELQVWDLEDRLKEQLRIPLANQLAGKKEPWAIPDLKAYLTKLDQSQRMMAENLAQQKAQAFAAQYAKAKTEAERRPPGKYSILTRSDSGYESGEDPAYWR